MLLLCLVSVINIMGCLHISALQCVYAVRSHFMWLDSLSVERFWKVLRFVVSLLEVESTQ